MVVWFSAIACFPWGMVRWRSWIDVGGISSNVVGMVYGMIVGMAAGMVVGIVV